MVYNLPDDYLERYPDHIRRVTVEDVNRVARRYLHPGLMAILVVGDRAAIEPRLRALPEVGATVSVVPPDEP